MESYEIVILGGGPAGCSVALSLLKQGISSENILVVEASCYDNERVGESIPSETRVLFNELGILESFLEQRHEPCFGSDSSWGSEQVGFNDCMYRPFGNGWHLDRLRFDSWIAQETIQRGIQIKKGMRFLDIVDRRVRGFRLALGVPGHVQLEVFASFVVDATGNRSLYAQRMGATRQEVDLLVGASAYFQIPDSEDPKKMSFLEAVDYGWWYTAGLPNRKIATALATSQALYKRHNLHRSSEWLRALAETRRAALMLSTCKLIENSYSVCTSPSFILDRVYGTNWLAIGDAASAYDPISSQGIYKAIDDGLSGGRAIAKYRSGLVDGLREFQDSLRTKFLAYSKQRAYFYNREHRFEQSSFWAERQRQSKQICSN